ncbi:MAG: hypothetical protein E7425_13720 [Ruminococcaceae bacterium]|jgi:hypothetical protein|nr:hypothetical protein [Oscillospiraceae bacterium]
MSGNTDFFPLERNRYFYGKLLTVRDFDIEQKYIRNSAQLMHRLVFGAGVVCGLGVSASDDSTLLIESGMAIDYLGRMVTVEEPLLRKLQMIDGQETLSGKESAYLCLDYQETDIEPVNAVGATSGESRQCNITREGARLFLTAQEPDYRALLEASGKENVSVLYSSDELSLVLAVPEAVCAGRDFTVELLVVKNEKTPPVYFQLNGESGFVDSEDGRIHLEFRESPEETRRVYQVGFRMKARQMSDLQSSFLPSGGEIDLELGSHRYKNYVEVDAKCFLCKDAYHLAERHRLIDNLEHRLKGRDIPIYLAKLELLHSAGSMFIVSVTNLPFDQRITQEGGTSGDGGPRTVTTTVRSLEYWQKPDVKANYQPNTGALHFDFGIPSPEQYDYAVSHGTVDLTLPGGVRVNSKVYSEEIPHGLGPGTVDVRLSIEFADHAAADETALCFGNSEIFVKGKGKNTPAGVPWVETAAVVYPRRGTMRVGLWLHDMVEGNRLTVHYFAQKPERDTSRILAQRRVGLSVTPEFSHVALRGTIRFRAEVTGSEDKSVRWVVKEDNGGVIDHNGIYQAPELPGTYEIMAISNTDDSVTASAFVIVE